MNDMKNPMQFKFFTTIDNIYNTYFIERFMINFSSERWKNRKSQFITNKEWILDSGGFNELGKYGKYSYSPSFYLQKVKLLDPTYFATMDYMCEPNKLKITGLTVKDHIMKTIENTLFLMDKHTGNQELMPVIQGWEIEDYLYCIDSMKELGIFKRNQLVGIGSICRRNQTDKIEKIITSIKNELPHQRLHGFGIKKSCLSNPKIVNSLSSSDSFAWSIANRFSLDLRGKQRRFFVGVWAREVELTAYKTLLDNYTKPNWEKEE